MESIYNSAPPLVYKKLNVKQWEIVGGVTFSTENEVQEYLKFCASLPQRKMFTELDKKRVEKLYTYKPVLVYDTEQQ